MLRWFLAKLSIIRKFFNFGDDSDNSDDNDNKNGALPPAAIKKDTGHRRRNTPNGRCTYNMTTVPGAFLNRAFRVSDTQ